MTELAADKEILVAIIASLFVICGVMIVAVVHVYTGMMRNEFRAIRDDNHRIDDSLREAHNRITNHIKEYHTVKS